jgi:hypothetical protein
MGAARFRPPADAAPRYARGFQAVLADGGLATIVAMPCDLPQPGELWRAIDTYLEVAYDGAPPRTVAERLSTLRAAGTALYDCDAIERLKGGYAIRLGNRFYPHMKLVVEASPGGRPLFRVDTHDRHFLDLVATPSPELDQLMARNQAITQAIEDAWSACGVRTARDDWRDQMAQRRSARRS